VTTSRNACWLHVATHTMVFGSAFYFFSFVSADPDLWGHIKFGEDLWKAKAIVRTDPYSYTAFGLPWINHEWLTELIFYGVYSRLGDAGLLVGKLCIGLSVVLLLMRVCASRPLSPLAQAPIMVLAASVISPGFMIRPQLFSFLNFALLLCAVHRYFGGRPNLLFGMPLLTALWVNLHGGFLMGWALLLTVTVWESAMSPFSRQGEHRPEILWLVLLCVTLATLLNPYGYRLLVFLYKTLTLQREITEWIPIPLFDGSHLHLKVLAALFLVTVAVTGKRSHGWEVCVIAMTLLASFRHQRHAPFFAMTVAPYLVFWSSRFASFLRVRFSRLSLSDTSRGLLSAGMFVLAACQIYSGASRYALARLSIVVDPAVYPVAAVRFMKANGIEGNVLVPFDWGEYVIWHLYPRCRVSIDGRFDTVYPESVIRDHFIAREDERGWQRLLEKYPSDVLLTGQLRFFQELIHRPGPWIYMYSDSVSIVFLRDGPRNREALERFRKDGLTYPSEAPPIYFE